MIKIPESKACATYCIENLTNRKKYIGRTTNLKRRITDHVKNFESGEHPNKEMLHDYQIGDDFIVYSIDEKSESEAIIKYDSINNGYNKVIPKTNIQGLSSISFAPLGRLLEKQGKKWYYLRENGISPGMVDKMRHGTGHINTKTILKVCNLLDCQPGDIMEYIPDTTRPNELHEDKTTRTTRPSD